MQGHFKSDSSSAEIASAALYMSMKVLEKKTGLSSPINMSKELFDSILGEMYNTPLLEPRVLKTSHEMFYYLKLNQTQQIITETYPTL